MTIEAPIDYRATFFDQFDALKEFPQFQKMARTVEDSPWHREKNVLVHTGMVVDEYVQMTDFGPHTNGMEQYQWTKEDYLGAMAAVFHDVGKPPARIEKFSEARGKYFAYHGHELLSARAFEDYAAQRFPMFSALDIVKICWIIEHHMPWSLEDTEKRRRMALTAKWVGSDIFCRHLLADQFGRTSDDQEATVERATSWVKEFKELVELTEDQPRIYDKCMYMPIAPSGAGKSTFLKTLSTDVRVYSLDRLRHEFYHPSDYTKAYQMSVDDKSFEARSKARFHAELKGDSDLYIDNVNLSAKRRKFYIDAARKAGYSPVAVLMPVSLDTIIRRQKTRPDKTVPDSAVRQQYNSLQLPMFGEFDQIIVSDHNLTK